MRVLAIDPGLTRCGVGIVDASPGRRVALVSVTVVRSDPGTDLAVRLHAIHAGLAQLIDRYEPDSVAVERVFSQRNTLTAMGTAQAAAMALLAADQAGIPVTMHTPSEVKAAVTGNGRAEKEQVGEMVRRLLRLTEIPKPADAADALALAICHAWRVPAQRTLRQATAGGTR